MDVSKQEVSLLLLNRSMGPVKTGWAMVLKIGKTEFRYPLFKVDGDPVIGDECRTEEEAVEIAREVARGLGLLEMDIGNSLNTVGVWLPRR